LIQRTKAMSHPLTPHQNEKLLFAREAETGMTSSDRHPGSTWWYVLTEGMRFLHDRARSDANQIGTLSLKSCLTDRTESRSLQVIRLIVVLLIVAGLESGCSATTPAATPAITEFRVADLIASTGTKEQRVNVEGRPQVVSGLSGPAAGFDGANDRLVLEQNPLAGADEFTIEVVLRPRDVYPNSPEPRFLHIESTANPERRLTMELRLTEQHEWYLDVFIKSEDDKLSLIDSAKRHPVGQWYHAAVTYRDGTFASFVNGRQELQGKVRYQPIPADARTSIGARLNRVHWFAGDIAIVRVTAEALPPSRLKGVPRYAR
jgi:Concanavalin A-like lectin/glucanases superfamily